jgi:hypothetical protein
MSPPEPAPPPSSVQVSAPLLARMGRLRWAVAALVAALAVAAVLLVRDAGPKPGVPLPVYTLSVEGNPPPRVVPGTPPELSPGGTITLTARPSEPLRGKVDVVVTIGIPNRAGGRLRSLADMAHFAADGTVTISGKTDDLFQGLSPGANTVTITLSRPGRFASEPGGAVELTQVLSWRGPPTE